MKKIGILGGTFDPIHFGHLILAEGAKELCNLDEVWFMPAKTPPHKLGKKVSEFSLRKSMIELAIQGQDGLYCSDFENTLEGNSYTFNTLEKLQSKYIDNEFYFIMGADSFYEIETWKNPDIILKIVKLIVASRDYSNENLTLKKHFEHLKSKYEIKWGQGTLLSFTTKNYIHELSDSTKGETGVGFKGEFEFIYFGK